MKDRWKSSVARAGSVGERRGGDQVQKVSGNWDTWGSADHVEFLCFILKALGSHKGC